MVNCKRRYTYKKGGVGTPKRKSMFTRTSKPKGPVDPKTLEESRKRQGFYDKLYNKDCILFRALGNNEHNMDKFRVFLDPYNFNGLAMCDYMKKHAHVLNFQNKVDNKHKHTLCYLLFIIGLLTKLLEPYCKIIIKGGVATQIVLSKIKGFSSDYETSDIDILILPADYDVKKDHYTETELNDFKRISHGFTIQLQYILEWINDIIPTNRSVYNIYTLDNTNMPPGYVLKVSIKPPNEKKFFAIMDINYIPPNNNKFINDLFEYEYDISEDPQPQNALWNKCKLSCIGLENLIYDKIYYLIAYGMDMTANDFILKKIKRGLNALLDGRAHIENKIRSKEAILLEYLHNHNNLFHENKLEEEYIKTLVYFIIG